VRIGPGVLLAACCLAASAGCGGSSVVRIPLSTTAAISPDGSEVAWLTRRCTIRSRDLSTGRVRNLGRLTTCPGYYPDGFQLVVSAGVASVRESGGGNDWTDTVMGYRDALHRPRTLFDSSYTIGGEIDGDVFGTDASSPDGVMWSWWHGSFRDERGTCEDDGRGCLQRVDGGGVATWSGGSVKRIAGAPPAAAVATSGDLVGVAALPRGSWTSSPLFGVPVEIVVLRRSSGRRVAAFPLPRDAKYEFDNLLAVSSDLAGLVYTDDGYGVRLVFVDWHDGRVVRRVDLGKDTFPYEVTAVSLSMSGTTALVQSAGSATLVSGRTGRTYVLGRGHWVSGAQLVGGRALWVENHWREHTAFLRSRSLPS